MPTFKGKECSDKVLRESPRLPSWKSLELHAGNVTDDGIRHLSKAEKLTEIEIVGCNGLTDGCLQALSQLPQLRSVFLWDAPWVSDEKLRTLSSMWQLTELYLEGEQITNAGLKHLDGLPHLWSLILDGTSISDAGIGRLTTIPRLKLLSFKGTLVEGTGFESFASHRQRRMSIYLESAPVHDDGVNVIARCFPKLKLISLAGTAVTDEAVIALAELKGLGQLWLQNTAVTDAGMQHLIGHPSLAMLYVEGTAVSEGMIARLEAASQVELFVYE